MTNLIALPTGTELVGDYRIERVLGAGGFGITYLADELALDRPVTIKEYFPSDFATRSGSHEAVPRSRDCSKDYRWGLDRFIEEAQTLARFDHPNIVRVYRYFRANNTGYMVLHWEEGKSLKTWLKELKRAPRQNELDEIIAPLLEALAIIHKADFLHRDIAPDNIIVRKSGAPVLIDFGSARGEIAAHSKTVSALVKPGYSPYEQYAETSRQQGPWSDIYALGATLYHAVTGKRPPDAPSRMVHDEIVPAREAAISAYRPSFLAAIDRALALEIKDRPQSIALWRGDLLAPEPPRQGWLSKALDQKREQEEADERQRLDKAHAAAVAQQTTPPPPDIPGPKGGLLDFLDRMKSPKEAAREAKDAANVKPVSDAKPTPAAEKPAGQDATPTVAEEAANAKNRPAADQASAPQKQEPKSPPSEPKAAAATSAGATVALDPAERPRGLKFKKPASSKEKPARTGRKADKPVVKKEPDKAQEKAQQATPEKAKNSAQQAARAAKAEIVPVAPRRAPKLFTRQTKPKPVKPRKSRHLPPLFAKFAIGACVATAAVMIQNRLPELATGAHQFPTGSISRNEAAPANPQVKSVTAHAGGASLIRYSADGTRIYTAGTDATLKVWRAASLTLIRSIPLDGGAATALTVKGDMALTGHTDGRISLWDTATARKRTTFHRNEADVWSLAFTGVADQFLAATHDWKVTLWDTANNTDPIHVFNGHENAVQALATSPELSLAASGGADRTVKLWNLKSLDLVRTYRGPRDFITSVAISPDGKHLAASSLDGSIRLWSTNSRRQNRRFTGHQGAVNQVAFAPDSKHLVSAGRDGTVRLWDIGKRRAIRAYTGHTGEVKAARFSPDGKHLASVGSDGTLRLWRVPTSFSAGS
ncbi:MAG: protein kinase [Hyphomicrobiaceae bacterium]|nr:protein kinase [Hyphomicrobiaceae bacterium]MCC0011652.1 protein kinase [Hyphomicrobiaceae bacterium]